MFSIGDKIVYGSEGVFYVAEYASSPVSKDDTRSFYILKPLYGPETNIIYTPIDNQNVKMRAVFDKEKALEFIKTIGDIRILTVEREKNRREVYRTTLARAECEAYVSIIKTVRLRREEFAKAKKRLSESDNDYEKKSKFCLYGELSVALDIPFDQVESVIEKDLNTYNI